MKLLFDQNTSPSLAGNLDDLFPGSDHVYNLQMHERPDTDVWEFAHRNDFIVLTKDIDFSELSMQKGFHLSCCGSVSGTARRSTSSNYFASTTM